jgi:hypothetical protein
MVHIGGASDELPRLLAPEGKVTVLNIQEEGLVTFPCLRGPLSHSLPFFLLLTSKKTNGLLLSFRSTLLSASITDRPPTVHLKKRFCARAEADVVGYREYEGRLHPERRGVRGYYRRVGAGAEAVRALVHQGRGQQHPSEGRGRGLRDRRVSFPPRHRGGRRRGQGTSYKKSLQLVHYEDPRARTAA